MNALLLTLCSLTLGPTEPEVTPLEVSVGKLDLVLDTSHAGERYVLVLGSLADWNQPSLIRYQARSTTDRPTIPRLAPMDFSARHRELRARKKKWSQARENLQLSDEFVPPAQPVAQKWFHLYAGEGDLYRRDQYQTIAGRLQTFNRHCQVYLDAKEHASPELERAMQEIVHCFEREVLPWAETHIGKADDVDQDGRFTIFLTGRLSRLQGGKTALDGFVRGSDFLKNVPEPFGNRCDMLTLNSALRAGPYLRTILLHEYVHAVTFCGHALRRYPEGPNGTEEESWLNESLSHLAEDLCNWSQSNLEHRVRAYLKAPQDYPLVVPDAFSAGLWRSPGVRGAGFLFLRLVYQKTGAGLLRDLAQSNLRGIENLETATGRTFEELFREYAIQLGESSRGEQDGVRNPYPLAAACLSPLVDGEMQEFRLAGTACCVLHIPTNVRGRTLVTLRFAPGLSLQATLLRMPEN